MDCGLSGFSAQGILQARILEWVAISFSRGSSTQGLLHCKQIIYRLSYEGIPLIQLVWDDKKNLSQKANEEKGYDLISLPTV